MAKRQKHDKYYIMIVNKKTGSRFMDFENKRAKAMELVLMINSRSKHTDLKASYIGIAKDAKRKVIA